MLVDSLYRLAWVIFGVAVLLSFANQNYPAEICYIGTSAVAGLVFILEVGIEIGRKRRLNSS